VRFEELRDEYHETVVGDLINDLVLSLTGSICWRYPEAVYNDGLSWDEHSISELAQDVVVNRLIAEGQVDYIFAEATTTESVRRLLTRQIKRELNHRRDRTPIDRLLERVKTLATAGDPELSHEAFLTYRQVGSAASWTPMTSQQATDAVNAARTIPILYSRTDTSRESQIYTTPALREVLASIFSVVEVLTEKELREIFERLLTPWTPTNLVPIDESDIAQDEPMSESTYVELSEAAHSWVASLSGDECWVYYYRSLDQPDAVAAARIGRSRPTVVNIKQRVLQRAAEDFLSTIDSGLHIEAVRLAQEHCARRLGEFL